MPTTDEHLRLAIQLRKFLEEGKPLELPGTQIEIATGACYWSALHYIDATLAFPQVNEHPDSEGQRIKLMNKLGHLTKLVRHQRFLNDSYYDLMYRGKQMTPQDFEMQILDSYREIAATTERILRGQGHLK